jgi:hypothetical protein
MPNDLKDRHVTAAAVQCAAQLIVTANVKDFAALPSGVDVQTPDDLASFLLRAIAPAGNVDAESCCARSDRCHERSARP